MVLGFNLKKLLIPFLVITFLSVLSFAEMSLKRCYDFTGGLDEKRTDIFVNDNNATAIQNVMFVERGAIKKRTGYVKVSTTTVNSGVAINGLYDYQQSDGDSYLVAASTSYIKKLATDVITWTTICSTSSATSTDYYDWTTHQDYCIITDGKSIPKKYDGGDQTTNIETGTDPDDWRPNVAKYCESWDDRLFLGNITDANGGVTQTTNYNRVRYSADLGSTAFEGADAWPATNYFDIDDVSITGMAVLGPRLSIFGPNSITIVAGDETSYTINYYVKKIIEGIGCISNNSIQNVGNELFFLDESGHIYAFDNGSIRLLSDSISTTIDGLNHSKLNIAVSGVYPKYHQYWLAVANGSSSTNNLVLVYDYILNAWTKYSGINAGVMALRKIDGIEYLYTGDATTGSYVFKQDYGNNDNSTAINAYFTTKNFGVDLEEFEKKFEAVYLTLKQSGNWDLTVEQTLDYGRMVITTDVNLTQGTVLWGHFNWGAANWTSSNAIIDNKISLSEPGKFLKLKFSNANADEPFTIYGFTIQHQPYPLR